MRRHPKISLLTALTALSAIAIAGGCAQQAGLSEGVDGAFIRAAQTWDLNHDGIVTCDEWRNYARQLYKAADKNRDGKMTREEFAIIAKQDRLFETANFDYFDAGRKGYVTEADFVDKPNPAFLALDPERRCQLSTAQLRTEITPKYTQQNNPGIPGNEGR
jgi:hypothetical protein